MNRGFPAHRRVAAFARRRRRENPLDPAARPGPPYAMASSFFIDVLLAVCAILGAIGFFRANAAHAELRALRRLMEERENPAPPIPAAVPETIPATVDIAPVEDPPAPADPPPEIPTSPARETPKLDLETLLTAKWGVWLGSAALLLSGVFLIRHAVDQGLLFLEDEHHAATQPMRLTDFRWKATAVREAAA